MKLSRFSIYQLLVLFTFTCHSSADAQKQEIQTGISPWVTVYAQQKDSVVYFISYITDKETSTIIAKSLDRNAIETFLKSSLANNPHTIPPTHPSIPKEVQVFHFKGKAPGSTAKYGAISYKSTLHRHRISVQFGKTLYYSVYDGNGFSKCFAIRGPAEKGIKAFHVGHTSSIYRWRSRRVDYFPKDQLSIIDRGKPNVVLHSGDFMISPYNTVELRRETLDTFGQSLGSLPLLVSASNHDQGWPQTDLGSGWIFRHLLKYRYEDGTLNHFCDFGPFRFIMLNYMEMSRKSHLPKVMKALDKWTKTKRPIVLVWGGSKKNLWPVIQEYAASKPQIRLILGGDGASHEVIKLRNGAIQIQNGVFDVVELDMNAKRIDIVIHRKLRRNKDVLLSIECSPKRK